MSIYILSIIVFYNCSELVKPNMIQNSVRYDLVLVVSEIIEENSVHP